MKRLFILLLIIPLLSGWNIHGGINGSGNTGGAFVQLKIGAGGYVTNFQFANDGTVAARTDTAGAFVCQAGQGKCKPVITQASMPASDTLNTYGSLRGVCEIAIAPT